MRGVGIVIALVGGLLLFVPFRQQPADSVAEAFDKYEQIWRVAAVRAAEALDDGELTTDWETREFLSEANQAARRQAFEQLAIAEQELLGDEWTAEKHAAILRGYGQ